MDVSKLPSYYTDYASAIKDTSTSEMEKTAGSLGKGSAESESEKMLEVCKEFESYLWEQVFKEMEKTTNPWGDEEEDGYASRLTDYFKDTVIQEISSQTTEQESSNSLAQLLYEQMKRNYNID